MVSDYDHHLTLAHLVEADADYRRFYSNLEKTDDSCIIMDNGAFELTKEGKPMFPSNKLLDLAEQCKADYVVMTDYPGESGLKTRDKAEELAPIFEAEGFGSFYVPQSEIGDVDGLLEEFFWAANSPLVGYIGISILAAPNAFGVEKNNKLQRFLSRWKLCQLLDEMNFFGTAYRNGKKIHFLGMVDGPNEIDLVSPWIEWIDTWDSSAAIWTGIHGIAFDDSPTGLVDGKFELPVDFSATTNSVDDLVRAKKNMRYIDDRLNAY